MSNFLKNWQQSRQNQDDILRERIRGIEDPLERQRLEEMLQQRDAQLEELRQRQVEQLSTDVAARAAKLRMLDRHSLELRPPGPMPSQPTDTQRLAQATRDVERYNAQVVQSEEHRLTSAITERLPQIDQERGREQSSTAREKDMRAVNELADARVAAEQERQAEREYRRASHEVTHWQDRDEPERER